MRTLCIVLLLLFTLALRVASFAATEAVGYFPPAESQGGWRKLEKPEEVRRLGGLEPDKLSALKQWLLDSDKREFAAVVIRRGYLLLELEFQFRDQQGIEDARTSIPIVNDDGTPIGVE